jgi:hypothetical protein
MVFAALWLLGDGLAELTNEVQENILPFPAPQN